MSAAQDTATISIAPNEPATIDFPCDKLSAPVVHPWIAAFVGVLAFAIVGGIGALYFLKTRLDGLASTTTVTARQATDLTTKVGLLAGAFPISKDQDILVIANDGVVIRVPASQVRKAGRATQGVRVMRLEKGRSVAAVAPVIMQMEE